MIMCLYNQPRVLSLFQGLELAFDFLRVFHDLIDCKVEVGRRVIFKAFDEVRIEFKGLVYPIFSTL